MHQLVLIVVRNVPVVEITALILSGGLLLAVVDTQGLHLVPAESLLNLPAGHIGVGDGVS